MEVKPVQVSMFLLAVVALSTTRSTAQSACQARPMTLAPASGPTQGGTLVTITGDPSHSFFGCCVLSACPCPTLLFGGLSAQPALCTANELRYITPPHQPGTVAVSVDATFGSEPPAVLDGAFTYVGPPIKVPALSPVLLLVLASTLGVVAISRLR